ncbi:MAG TPA: hypothetical protein VFL76_00205 [Edaphocola sp.]|nr:hypothetical protein [Edaphocola sp.]
MKMKPLFCSLILAGMLCCGFAWAQQQKALPRATAQSFLNGGRIGNLDTVPVALFDSLISRNLVVKDSAGNLLPVASYNFVYVNRGVYADSTGRPVIKSDYLYTVSDNGTLPGYWKKALIPQVKAGDTAIFTDIRYYGHPTDSTKPAPLLYGNTLRLILTP